MLIPISTPTGHASPPPVKNRDDHAEGTAPAPGLGKKHYVLAGQICSPGASEPASDDDNGSDVEYRRQGPRQAPSGLPQDASGRSG